MRRGIGIIDTSNEADSPRRSQSLFERLEAEHPDIFPKPGELNWKVELCAPSDITENISNFWLVWVHDTYGSIDFEKTTRAAISQEERFRGSLPVIIVCYGGGAARYQFPSANPSVEELSVATRTIRTGELGLMVGDFNSDPAKDWNIAGFLLKAAETYPDIDKSELLDLLCSGVCAEAISAASVAHSILSIVQLLKGDMIRALDGSVEVRLRFSNKIPTLIRAIDDVLNSSMRVTAEEGFEITFNDLKTGLINVKNLIERLQKLTGWSGLNKDDFELELESLKTNCEIINRSISDRF